MIGRLPGEPRSDRFGLTDAKAAEGNIDVASGDGNAFGARGFGFQECDVARAFAVTDNSQTGRPVQEAATPVRATLPARARGSSSVMTKFGPCGAAVPAQGGPHAHRGDLERTGRNQGRCEIKTRSVLGENAVGVHANTPQVIRM